jgi:hypothetical protein
MRLYPLCCLLLLTGCFGRDSELIQPPQKVPADLLQPVLGYTGPVPQTEGQLSDALIAERRGRQAANAKLATIGEILNDEKPR